MDLEAAFSQAGCGCPAARQPLGKSARPHSGHRAPASPSPRHRKQERARNACSEPLPTFPVGDTGIEPVTSSVSGKRAPAAPIARADDGTRTRDPHLGKVMLYQLSHIRVTPLWGAGRKLAEVPLGGKTQSSPCPHEVSHAPPTRLDHRAAPGDVPGDAPT